MRTSNHMTWPVIARKGGGGCLGSGWGWYSGVSLQRPIAPPSATTPLEIPALGCVSHTNPRTDTLNRLYANAFNGGHTHANTCIGSAQPPGTCYKPTRTVSHAYTYLPKHLPHTAHMTLRCMHACVATHMHNRHGRQ